MIVRLKQSPPVLSNLQLNRALMARQFLVERVDLRVIEVLEHLVGMQAQVPASPYVGLWNRVRNFDPGQLSDLLVSRSAVRAVLMRSTLHLVSSRDLGAIWPLTRKVGERQFKSSQFARDLVGLEVGAIVNIADQVLKQSPRTQAALGKALASHWPDRTPLSLAYAVRSGLPLVQIPPRGLWGKSGQATWARAQDWLGRSIAQRASLRSMFWRYLAAFGPATIADFQCWSGLTGIRDRIEHWRSELRAFRDERGRELFDLAEGILPDPERTVPVRFLPEFDNALLAHADRSRVIPEQFCTRVIIGQPTVLIDGFVRGTWKLSRDRSASVLSISLFDSLPRGRSADLKRAANELAEFMTGRVKKAKIEMIIEAKLG